MKSCDVKDPVWYVCYGSNLLGSRFGRYITGGFCEENNKKYNGCSDKTLPSKNVAVELPYKLYFAKELGSCQLSAIYKVYNFENINNHSRR